MKKYVVLLVMVLALVPGIGYSGSQFENSLGMRFKYIKPGVFMMGSDKGGHGESPAHKVKISKGFFMQETEVTKGQWVAIMGTRPWSGQYAVIENGDSAAEYISWNDAQQYIRKLNDLLETTQYRLPTEAEWEYACRAGSKTKYHFGDNIALLKDYAWCGVRPPATNVGYAHVVAQKKANQWSLYDMHGNVQELVQDWYGYYSPQPIVESEGKGTGGFDRMKIVRGGAAGLGFNAWTCRSSYRVWKGPGTRTSVTGFRLVSQ